ncbi:hypothetical protein [Pantoea stewartii]|uniref:Phage tail protein n=1 Tax=Pantoea stewartii subsp. stewartii DC283 TaxID=660596 RepID=H3RDP7_PANSE|nr:hypothetical protein [Pantoea stewartii]ARF50037.1 hypothetical protein DSJ_12240 [Pantoea stewartii subsp. stewartii DC283]EHU00486.1 hypothetical protein CKS_2630 [Pantoea stewartii subsp. stewartii DC283]
MPLNNYTVGRDVQVDINTAYGVVTVPVVISFDAKPKVNQVDVTKITGETDTLMIPKNWEGTFDSERQDDTLDTWWALWESDYFAGINRAPGTITETITENNGAVTVWRYTSVQFNFTDPGKKQGDQTVRQSFAFTAKRRLKVA